MAKKQRRRRRTCPRIRPPKPKRISKKDVLDGLCDYIDPEGNHCNHWQAPDSEACYCHRGLYYVPPGPR